MEGASQAAAASSGRLTRAAVVPTRPLTVLGIVFALLAGFCAALWLFANAESPIVASSAAKDGVFAALCIVVVEAGSGA